MPRGRAADPVARLRQICLALPEMTERSSHGEPAWFVQGKKTVVTLDDHHHGGEHLAFWCPAPDGVQQEMVEQEPSRFFRPPYVGGRGWLGVRIDNSPDWDEVAQIVEDAYRMVAPKKLIALLDP
jgi:hypothetical protein